MASELLTKNSATTFCPDERIVVYGFIHCNFEGICSAFRNAGKKAFTWNIGRNFDEFSELRRFKPMVHRTASDVFKNALMYLVLDNYGKTLKGKEITPLIFCIDIEENPHAVPTAEDIFSRKYDYAGHEELRRMAALCFDPRIPSEIRKVALDTFKYVRVNLIPGPNGEKMNLQELPNPISEETFWNLYQERKITKDRTWERSPLFVSWKAYLRFVFGQMSRVS